MSLSYRVEKSRRRAHERVTIYEIARQAGVSATTVSRVLNETGYVSAETRSLITGLIQKLRFTPNAAARDLVSPCGGPLTVLYASSHARGLSRLLIGALEESRRVGVRLDVRRVEPGKVKAGRSVTQLLEGGVAGAILTPPVCDFAHLIEALHAAKIPTVAIAPGRPTVETLHVRIDEYSAAREMTQHLLALGHRRIAFIRALPTESASEERWEGFLAALRLANIDRSQVLVEQGSCSYRSGLEAGRRLLSSCPAPTAIFASNDEMAAAVIAEAHRRGIDVPGSLSVVGFGDTPAACNIWPELTTIHQPATEMAAEAVDLLVQAIRAARLGGPPQERYRLLPHTLVVRASASSAPAEECS